MFSSLGHEANVLEYSDWFKRGRHAQSCAEAEAVDKPSRAC